MLPDTFETARLLLRPVTIMDVDAIFGSYAQDEEVVRYLIWRPHRSRSETQAYVERCMATPSEVERTYMLVGRGDNVVRGALALRQGAPHPSPHPSNARASSPYGRSVTGAGRANSAGRPRWRDLGWRVNTRTESG
jgi:hypothetical protein